MSATSSAAGLKKGEILGIVYDYIGVDAGYLGDFTYQSHVHFYPMYCDLEIDPFEYLQQGTTRERFILVLEKSPPDVQAKIVRGVLAKYPVGTSPLRTDAARDRLVAMAERLERDSAVMVSAGVPAFTSEVVVRAIDDAETLLQTSGPQSAVDRVHTALHGHLGYLCDEAHIAYDREDTMVGLLKKLRKAHPRLRDLGTRARDIDTVLKASGSILDALNPVRNNASVAHPNAALLGREEAHLVINVGRSLLVYLDNKIALGPVMEPEQVVTGFADYPYEAYDELNDR
jgi:Abortive infection C-terminus